MLLQRSLMMLAAAGSIGVSAIAVDLAHVDAALAPRSSLQDQQATREQIMQRSRVERAMRRTGPSTRPKPDPGADQDPEDIACPAINFFNLDYQTQVLLAHNVPRANHGAANLTWDATLETLAQELATTCYYDPGENDDGPYGQILIAGYPAEQIGNAFSLLAEGEQYYPTPYGVNNPDLSDFPKWQDFSQMVWNATTIVGCYTQFCVNGITNGPPVADAYFTVCDYRSAGNVNGEFSNVGAPINCSEGLQSQ